MQVTDGDSAKYSLNIGLDSYSDARPHPNSKSHEVWAKLRLEGTGDQTQPGKRTRVCSGEQGQWNEVFSFLSDRADTSLRIELFVGDVCVAAGSWDLGAYVNSPPDDRILTLQSLVEEVAMPAPRIFTRMEYLRIPATSGKAVKFFVRRCLEAVNAPCYIMIRIGARVVRTQTTENGIWNEWKVLCFSDSDYEALREVVYEVWQQAEEGDLKLYEATLPLASEADCRMPLKDLEGGLTERKLCVSIEVLNLEEKGVRNRAQVHRVAVVEELRLAAGFPLYAPPNSPAPPVRAPPVRRVSLRPSRSTILISSSASRTPETVPVGDIPLAEPFEPCCERCGFIWCCGHWV